MPYNWQQKNWPEFLYNLDNEDDLLSFNEQVWQIGGMLKAMPEDSKEEFILNTMVAEAIKTSAIEGEDLNRQDVISSIRNNLGLNEKPEKIRDKRAEGAGALMIAVSNTYAEPLTEKTLFAWHTTLLESSKRIAVGAWRKHKEPMQVVSGAIGRERIHFEAPPSQKVPEEMRKFIAWFNDTAPGGKKEIRKAPVRSAIAHLYFESIHPFEDGNGRIGRAIAEKALSQTIGRPVLLSLSQTIETNKKAYYAALENAQSSSDVSNWVSYFIHTVLQAQLHAENLIGFTLKKAKFFDRYQSRLNERQLKVINRMMEAWPQNFEGGMTTKKYIAITKTSKATATRDLQELAEIGILNSAGSGRSVHYNLVLP
jgi:Fic family protein